MPAFHCDSGGGGKKDEEFKRISDDYFNASDDATPTKEGTPGDQLPDRPNDKAPTQGVLVFGNSKADLSSIEKGPSADMRSDTPVLGKKWLMAIRWHVEGHAAALMRLFKIAEADLYINNTPCPGEWGCDAMLPHMLPEGSTLRVYFKDAVRGVDPWSVRTYSGIPDSAWKDVKLPWLP